MKARQEGKRARGQEGKRCSGHLDTHEDRYHLSNEALVLNEPGGHRKRERKVFGGEENMFPHCHFKKVKAGTNLLIVTRPILDLREILMRITQKEMRQVMVFEREREI